MLKTILTIIALYLLIGVVHAVLMTQGLKIATTSATKEELEEFGLDSNQEDIAYLLEKKWIVDLVIILAWPTMWICK